MFITCSSVDYIIIPSWIPEDYIVLGPLHIYLYITYSVVDYMFISMHNSEDYMLISRYTKVDMLHILWLITCSSPWTILKITCSFRGIPSGYVHVQICEKNEYKTYRSYGRTSNTPLTSSDFLHISQSCDIGPSGHQTWNHLCHGPTNALT